MEIEDDEGQTVRRPKGEEDTDEKKAQRTSEKRTRAVILVCCVIITIITLFNFIASIVQYNNINKAINNIDANGIETKLNDINEELSNIERQLRHR
jgi:predicted PurR-regulated permease PerM